MHTQWTDAALFRPPRRGTLAQAIADHIRRRIVTGDISPGRRLPSIRMLARLFAVSVPTIESAVQALVALGFVRVSHGVGIFVAEAKDHTALLRYVWRVATTHELAMVRAAIDERAPAVVAAQVATQPPIRMPRTLSDIGFFAHERSIQRSGDPESFLEADVRFHCTVLASMRGIEVGPALYEGVLKRLQQI
ncbi:MAG: FadR/GntR family transcriptional regulator, partial [Candidatus Limnocylindria bacterium]